MVIVLFDFYKTIFEPIYSEKEAVDRYIRKLGKFLSGFGLSIESINSAFYDTICIFERVRKISLFDAPVDILIKNFASKLGIFDENLIMRLLELYTEELVASVRPYPDAEEALRTLKENDAMVGIVSNAHQIYFVRNAFSRYGLDKYVDGFFISGDIGVRKPDPNIFKYAVEKLRRKNDEQAFMIGDDFVSDFYGALLAGIEPILVVRNLKIYERIARVIKEGNIARSLIDAVSHIVSRALA